MRNQKRALRTSRQEQLLTKTCYLALNLINTLLQHGAPTLNSNHALRITLHNPMNSDTFEPAQDENLPSLSEVLKTAEHHASIDADIQDASSLDLGPRTLDSLSPAKGESEKAW